MSRVLLAIDYFRWTIDRPSGARKRVNTGNGVSKSVREMTHRLANQGHEIAIASPAAPLEGWADCCWSGIYPLDESPSHEMVFEHFGPYEQHKIWDVPRSRNPLSVCRTLIDGFQPDAVHVFSEARLGRFFSNACVKGGRKFTSSLHNVWPEQANVRSRLGVDTPSLWGNIVKFHNRGTRMMTRTDELVELANRRGIKRACCWPGGADLDAYGYTPIVPFTERPTILYPARLSAEKDHESVIELPFDCEILLAGEGERESELKQKYAPEVASGRVKFLGKVHPDRLAELYKQCSLVVVPSKVETFAVIIVEAWAAGRPVACRSSYGSRYLFERAPRDVGAVDDDFAEAVRKTLELRFDGELASRCRSAALPYSWDNSTEIFWNHLDRAA